MSTQLVDLRRLSPTCAFLSRFKRAFRIAGQQYREELALLAAAHQRQMATLAATYDRELASLAADFAAMAREYRERRAIAEAVAERALEPWKLLH